MSAIDAAMPARSNRSWSLVTWVSRAVLVATKLREQRVPLANSSGSMTGATGVFRTCGIACAHNRARPGSGLSSASRRAIHSGLAGSFFESAVGAGYIPPPSAFRADSRIRHIVMDLTGDSTKPRDL